VYFYELHEGDEDVFSDVVLAHEVEFDESEFLDLVLEARGEVLDRFEEDSLVEAIATASSTSTTAGSASRSTSRPRRARHGSPRPRSAPAPTARRPTAKTTAAFSSRSTPTTPAPDAPLRR
jgi:hypothetical protein